MTKAEIIETLIKEANLREWLAMANNDRASRAHANCVQALREAAELLKAAPEWISVKDRLPDEKADVVVVIQNGYGYWFRVAYREQSWWVSSGRRIYDSVTHWMPLPEPPKQNGGEHE